MNNAKKFYLLDASQVKLPENKPAIAETAATVAERIKPIKKRETESLDKLMFEIANAESLSDEEKVNRYNAVLANFRVHYNSAPQKQSWNDDSKNLSAAPSQRPRGKTSDLEDGYDAMISVGKNYQPRARKVLKLLEERGKMSVSKNGEIVIDGKPVPSSNISDLLNASVNRKAYSEEIIGLDTFRALMDEANVPKTLAYIPGKLEQSFIDGADAHSPTQDFYTPPPARTAKKRRKQSTPKILWESHTNSPRTRNEKKKAKAV